MSVRPRICLSLLFLLDTFHEVWYSKILQKSVEEIRVSKNDKNNVYFFYKYPIMYICDNIMLQSS